MRSERMQTALVMTFVLFLFPLAALHPRAMAADGDTLWSSGGVDAGTHLATDGNGGAIFAWTDGSGDVYARRVNSTGTNVWGPVQVSATAAVAGSEEVAEDGTGGAIVAWKGQSPNTGIFARRINASGVPQWAGPVLVLTAAETDDPSMCGDGAGGAFIANYLRLAHIDAGGALLGPGLNGIDLGYAYDPRALVPDGAGGAIVAWSNAGYDIVAQRVSGSLTLPWGPTPIVIGGGSRTDYTPTAAPDGAGGALIAWYSYNFYAPQGGQVRVQRVAANGTAAWSADGVILVDSTVVGGSATAWMQYGVWTAVTSDGGGGAIVAWNDWRNDPTAVGDDDLYVHRVNSAGTSVWTANGVIVYASRFPGSERYPRLVSDGVGGAIVTFSTMNVTSWWVDAARLSAAGTRQWHDIGVLSSFPPEDAQYPQIVFDASGPSPVGAILCAANRKGQKIEISPPPNDSCAGAVVIGAGQYLGTLVGAANDGSASCGGGSVGVPNTQPDVWYSYTAPGSGTLKVNTCGTNDWGGTDAGMDTVLSLHSACPGTVANELACNDDWITSTDPTACTLTDTGNVRRDSAISRTMTLGETVLIRVSKYYTSVAGSFVLNVTFEAAPPPNDACGAATSITDGQYHGTLVGATSDGGTSCFVSRVRPDVWYRYRAMANGILHVNTCGTNDPRTVDAGIDTVLSVHSACPGTPSNELICNDNWPDGNDPTACVGADTGDLRDSAVAVPVLGEDLVLIRVSSVTGEAGPFVLNVHLAPPAPANDACANAFFVNEGAYPFSTVGATTDGPDEPGACNFRGYTQIGSDIWYCYTPSSPVAGTARVSLCDATYDTKLAVYSGCACPPVDAPIACDDDACGVQSRVTFWFVPGTSYLIRIGGRYDAQGSGTMSIDILMPPFNDERDAAVCLADGSTVFSDSTAATGAGGSSCGTYDTRDVWFSYRPRVTGTVTFSLCGSAFDTTLAVQDLPGTELACNDDFDCNGDGSPEPQSQLGVQLDAGMQYLIRVAGAFGATGGYQLSVSGGGGQCGTPSDFDGDGDVDLTDFLHFQACFNGPNRPYASTGCADADLDDDADVDLADFLVFQSCFNGPNRPPAC